MFYGFAFITVMFTVTFLSVFCPEAQRNLMRLELQETQKAALHALIEEIVAYLDARVEVEYIQPI